jgi:hypothetical protein
MLKVIYRISDVGYQKIKPSYINNENCYKNAIKQFPPEKYQWNVIADSVSEETKKMLETELPKEQITHVNIAKGPGYTFVIMLNKMLEESKDDDILYFLENDYIHKKGSDLALLEGINLGVNYVTLYDHPDKYKEPKDGGNPYCEGASEETRVYLTNSCHWKLTNSTTGTFAGLVSSFKKDYDTIMKWANQPHWRDFEMFTELRMSGRSLISPIPGYSTHGETAWLSPLTDWNLEL